MTVAMLKRSQLPRSEWPEKRALAGELRAMSDRELLALILGSGVRDANVKQVAATLLRKFGEDLLTADAAALRQVKGVGEVKAARLAAAFELYRKLANGSALRPVKTPQDAYWVCQDLASEKQQVLRYLALDVRNRLLERVDLYKGNETLAVPDPNGNVVQVVDPAVGGLLAVTQEDGTYLPLYDGNGNVCDYAGTNGTVVAHREYDPFGETIALSGTKKDDFAFWFSTKPLDPDTGLYGYTFRDYRPEWGRWLSRDHLQEVAGQNLYCYVDNRAVDSIDPLGLDNFPADVVVFDASSPGRPNAWKYDPGRDWGDWDPHFGGRKDYGYDGAKFQREMTFYLVIAGDACEVVIGGLWAPASWAFDTKDMALAISDVREGYWISGSACVVATSIGYLPFGDLVKKPVTRGVRWLRRGVSKPSDEAVERFVKTLEDVEVGPKRGRGGRGGSLAHAKTQQLITDTLGGEQEVVVRLGDTGFYRISDNRPHGIFQESAFHEVGDMRSRGGFRPSGLERAKIEDIRKARGPDVDIIFHDKTGQGPSLINPDLQSDWRTAPVRYRKWKD